MYLAGHGDINLRDSTYLTPLHWAARAGHHNIVEVLVGGGADKNVCDQQGVTPLHWASGKLNLACVLLLLAKGAARSPKNWQGKTPQDVAGRWLEDGEHKDCDLVERTLLALESCSDEEAESEYYLLVGEGSEDEGGEVGVVREAEAPGVDERIEKMQDKLDHMRAQYRGLEEGMRAKDRELEQLKQVNQQKDVRCQQLERQIRILARQVKEMEEEARQRMISGSDRQRLISDHTSKVFPASQIEQATGNWSASKIIGRGAFGGVYRCELGDQDVAIKKLEDTVSAGGAPDAALMSCFQHEVAVLQVCRHQCIVPLLGIGLNPWCLVYPYMANGSLDQHLRALDKRKALAWEVRIRIAGGVAQALDYLHHAWGPKPAIIHRDIKAANVLLDADMNPRLGDHGIARVMEAAEGKEGSAATSLQGTVNYLDPSYIRTGLLTDKSDCYSLGVLMLELLLGSLACAGLVNRVKSILEFGPETLVDGAVEWAPEAVRPLAALITQCLNENPAERPAPREIEMRLTAIHPFTLCGAFGRTCKICLQATCNTRFLPCHHSVACEEDAKALVLRGVLCPICREPIEEVEVGDFRATFVP
ncbi:unnamed protein product [Chrysoparadoxa australica]